MARAKIVTLLFLFSGTATLVWSTGCGGSSSSDEDALTASAGGSAGSAGSVGTGGCAIAPQDPSKLGPGCCEDGPAHCVDDGSVPGNLATAFDTCKTPSGKAGHCMPDNAIKAGSGFKAPACTMALFKKPGVCLSKCVGLIKNNPQGKILQQDDCKDDGDVCVPCVNPLDGMSTGACELPAPSCPGQGGGGAGGAAGKGGAAGASGSGTCPYVGPPVIDPKGLPECGPACGGAHCLPESFVSKDQQALLSPCKDATGKAGFCTPDKLIETGGNFVPKTCKSVAGVEGRCTSACLPAIASQASLLSKDVCDANELCAPCFNPLETDPAKADTGACHLACDKPKDPPTKLTCPYTGPPVVDTTTFPDCSPACGGAHCVPSSLVPAAQAGLLAKCSGPFGAGLCTPDSLVKTGGQGIPKTCKSVGGVEGRCTSTCLPDIQAQASLLPKDVCDTNELCAPCYNPLETDPAKADTGACHLACDKPKDPPGGIMCPYTGPPVVDVTTFPDCSPACGGAHCVPSSLIPASQSSLLAKCSGPFGAGYCAPDSLVATGGQGIPKTCTSVAGVEGRCTSTCLPDIQSQAAVLPKDVCAANELCAPCFNPLESDPAKANTGACGLACDKPKDPPTTLSCPYTGPDVIDPNVFPACSPACGGAHCMPAALVPADQASQLTPCAGGYCTPDSLIKTGAKGLPKTCTSIAGAEGRCVSTCLPAVAAQASLLPTAGCDGGEVCAPCFNPTDKDPTKPTGVCNIACDSPKQPPLILMCPYTGPSVIDPSAFPDCSPACGGAHCVPESLISDPAQATQLAKCTSGSGPGYCAPDSIVASGGLGVPTSCSPFPGTSSEGRCTSKCLPAIAAQASTLSQSTCTPDELCAPCYDPFTGMPTGACSLSCDMPKSPPFEFPGCCADSKSVDRGTCVPKGSIPASQQGSLTKNTCPTSAADYLCVPEEYLPGSTIPVPTCNSLFGAGACVPTCVNLGIGGIFGQGNCPDNHYKCIPCSLAPAGTPGCP